MRDAAGRETLVGRRFGSWVVTRDGEVGGVDRRVACRCDCGNERTVSAKSLARGTSRSCGRCPNGPRGEELRARLDGLRTMVGELMPPRAVAASALLVFDGCAPELLNALEAAGGLRVNLGHGELVHFDGPRVSLRAHLKGKP